MINFALKRIALFAALMGCSFLFVVQGCVTAHEATVEFRPVDIHKGGQLDGCFLLTIESRSTEKVGSWWIVGQDSVGSMIPRSVNIRKIDSGANIHQSGKVVVLVGPYVKDYTIGYDYWVYRPGYQPTSFQDIRLERDYEAGNPVKISMEHEVSSDDYSDEKILDGARKLIFVGDLLPITNPLSRELFELVYSQVTRVRSHSLRSRNVNDAAKLMKQIEKCLKRFPTDKSPSGKVKNTPK